MTGLQNRIWYMSQGKKQILDQGVNSSPGVVCQYFHSRECSKRGETIFSFESGLCLGRTYVVEFGHVNMEDRVDILLPSRYLIKGVLSSF